MPQPSDLRLDVPARAFINAQLISLVERGGTLHEAKNHLFSTEPYASAFSKADIYAYPVCDSALAVSLLYCTVVVPREFLDLPENHQVYRDFDAQPLTGYFRVIEPDMDSYRLIRCLRNSAAHALFKITNSDGDVLYEFYTEREPILKRAIIVQEKLFDFLRQVGGVLASAVLAKKRDSLPDRD